MSQDTTAFPSLIDRSVKLLFRDRPDVLIRLARFQGTPEAVSFEDANLNFAELRADHVLRIHPQTGRPPYALYVEYQLQPDANLLPQ